MKITKNNLLRKVELTRNRVASSSSKAQGKASSNFKREQLEKLDKNLTYLKKYYKAKIEHDKALNDLVDFMNDNNLVNYAIHRKDTVSWEIFLEEFLHRTEDNGFPGITKVKESYSNDRKVIFEQYEAILTNVKNMPPKKGFNYLEELGFDLAEFKENETSLPLVVVDKSKLGLPLVD